MSGIQIFLISGVLFILIYFINRVRQQLWAMGCMLVLAAVSFIFILRPELTNRIAHSIGVGRGVDLVFYICILLFWFIVLHLYTRIRKLEEKLTILLRQDAIKNSKEWK